MDQTQIATRSRTYTWSDPSIAAGQLGLLDGLAFLRAIGSDEIPHPPVMDMLGVEGLEVAEGRVVVTITAQEYHYNPLGTVHGGVLATLLDTATGCAVHSTLPAGFGYTSLDLTTKYLRPVTVESGQLTCVGTVLSRGRRTALAQAELTDGRGRLVAHATSSCLLFEISSERPR